jgi:outer membrane protein assembly factor BamB
MSMSSRPAPGVARRRRVVVGAGALSVALVAASALGRGGGHASAPNSRPSSQASTPTTVGVTPTTLAGAAPVTVDVASSVAEAWHLPSTLSRAVALAVNGKLTVYGGLRGSKSTIGDVVSFDASTGAATPAGTLARPVHDAAGAVLGTRTVIFGGGAQTVYDTVQAIDGQTGSVIGHLPTPRADLVAVPDGGRVLIVGGYDGTIWLPAVLATTDGVSFTTVGNLPEPVRYPVAGVVGGKLYVIGGENPDKTDSRAVQELDLATGQGRVIGRLSDGLKEASGVVLNGQLLVMGGISADKPSDLIRRLDPTTGTVAPIGRLPMAVSDAAVAAIGERAYLVGGNTTRPVDSVLSVQMTTATAATLPPPSAGTVVFDGHLLIADRGNNRLLVVDQNKNILWQYPSATAPAPAQGFYFPDDAFFARGGTQIVTNEEEQHTILVLSYPDGKLVSSYGHPDQPGSAPGYLNQPDDAFLLKNGQMIVADAKNCRITEINADMTFLRQIGTTGRCHTHNPPTGLAYPNGDTPLANGNILVSEINGSWVDELTLEGQLVWSLHLPLTYPSDPQQIGPDLYLIADYARPGGVYEFTREGKIVWSYAPASGEAMLDHPSLAELLPTGLISVNDDYRQRVVLIDPNQNKIVWQYGQTDHAGTGPNQLNTPDGFDLLAPDKTTPTHLATG